MTPPEPVGPIAHRIVQSLKPQGVPMPDPTPQQLLDLPLPGSQPDAQRRIADPYNTDLAETNGTVTVSIVDLALVLNQRLGHSHTRPGVWDDDNPPWRAGKTCHPCAARERLNNTMRDAVESGAINLSKLSTWALAALGYRGHWLVDRAAAIQAGTWTPDDERACRGRLGAELETPGQVDDMEALVAKLTRGDGDER